MAETRHLSEKEIWDDSALQNSWNEALDEYNRYHSIHARGEKVEDVLREFEATSDAMNGNTEQLNNDFTMNDHDNSGVEAEEEIYEDNVPVAPSTDSASPQKNKDDSKSKAQASPLPGMPSLPDNLIGAVHDEDLKRLLMSWYYSGYYTGLYEGKQSARQTNPTR